MTQHLLRIENLVISSSAENQNKVYPVRNVSLILKRNQTTALVGESGSGKTLTALAIMGLLNPKTLQVESGAIHLLSKNLVELSPNEMRQVRSSEIAFIFQDPMNALNPTMKIGNQLIESYIAHYPRSKKQAKERALKLLEEVGIINPTLCYHQYPFELSGGMCQRVMIAMALMLNPSILIADEPTTSLDVTIQAQIIELLKKIQARYGMSILFITHDLLLAKEFTDHIYVMYAGKIVEKAPTKKLFTSPQHPYTQRLLNSLPLLTHDKNTPLNVIEGVPPAPFCSIIGCGFAPRCSKASSLCTQTDHFSKEHSQDHNFYCNEVEISE